MNTFQAAFDSEEALARFEGLIVDADKMISAMQIEHKHYLTFVSDKAPKILVAEAASEGFELYEDYEMKQVVKTRKGDGTNGPTYKVAAV